MRLAARFSANILWSAVVGRWCCLMSSKAGPELDSIAFADGIVPTADDGTRQSTLRILEGRPAASNRVGPNHYRHNAKVPLPLSAPDDHLALSTQRHPLGVYSTCLG